jgi:hypothetical protein
MQIAKRCVGIYDWQWHTLKEESYNIYSILGGAQPVSIDCMSLG